jgi:hypothetical protein
MFARDTLEVGCRWAGRFLERRLAAGWLETDYVVIGVGWLEVF